MILQHSYLRRFISRRLLKLPNSAFASHPRHNSSIRHSIRLHRSHPLFFPRRFFSSHSTTTFYPGPPLRLGTGRIANLTASSVIGTCGDTVVLATVATEIDNDHDHSSFFTVDYRQRAAAVGRIPRHNRRRQDLGRPTDSEVLTGRAIDRALRPLWRDGENVGQYQVSVTVQAASSVVVATALNAAVAAVRPQLRETVAATVVRLRTDGSVVVAGAVDGDDDEVAVMGELLYAGTRDRTVMLEWTTTPSAQPLPEADLERLMELAHAAIQPYLDTIDELEELRKDASVDGAEVDADADDRTESIRLSLGLPPLESPAESEDPSIPKTGADDESSGTSGDDISSESDSSEEPEEDTTDALNPQQQLWNYREQVLANVVERARAQLTPSLHRLFGHEGTDAVEKDTGIRPVFVHTPKQKEHELYSKQYRGQREQVMQEEIIRIVDELLEEMQVPFMCDDDAATEVPAVSEDAPAVESARSDETTSDIVLGEADRVYIRERTIYKLLRRALWETSHTFGTRSDHRAGGAGRGQAWKTIRPLSMTIPALPDAVHGSALFARGDTQVLCTVTLGAPSDGPDMTDPFVQPEENNLEPPDAEEDKSNDIEQLPIGSLRFLRTQEALESDLNSRKAKADRERTGESGTLAEVKRAFLQYDFPSFSTGTISKRKGGIDRRAIGHGSLAERAILPLLPDAETFPYSIRMTSEVTDSNGSSSMASVCGASLALADAGVPLKDRAAGVSVGLAVKHDDVKSHADELELEDDEFSLLLDITGTEDHVSAAVAHVAPYADKKHDCSLPLLVRRNGF